MARRPPPIGWMIETCLITALGLSLICLGLTWLKARGHNVVGVMEVYGFIFFLTLISRTLILRTWNVQDNELSIVESVSTPEYTRTEDCPHLSNQADLESLFSVNDHVEANWQRGRDFRLSTKHRGRGLWRVAVAEWHGQGYPANPLCHAMRSERRIVI